MPTCVLPARVRWLNPRVKWICGPRALGPSSISLSPSPSTGAIRFPASKQIHANSSITVYSSGIGTYQDCNFGISESAGGSRSRLPATSQILKFSNIFLCPKKWKRKAKQQKQQQIINNKSKSNQTAQERMLTTHGDRSSFRRREISKIMIS